MQIHGVRHHGRADDADREQQRLRVGDLRRHHVHGSRPPVDRRDEHLDQVAERNDAHHRADDELDRPEAVTLQHQQRVGEDCGYDHAGEQRDVKQQRKTDGAAQEFGQVGRHRGDLADPPHSPDQRRRKVIAAHLREILAGHDAELGRKRLEQHRDQIGDQNHPEQGVAVFGAGLDVGGEVARIDIGDRGDDRRTGQRRIGPPGAPAAAVAGKHRAPGRDRALR